MFKTLITITLISLNLVHAQEKTNGHNGKTVVEERIEEDRENKDRKFSLIPHRPNYFLPVSYYSNPNQEVLEAMDGTGQLSGKKFDYIEAKIQFSFRYPVATGVVFDDDSIWIAYTQLSLWQVYNGDASAPFRETNYEPEAFWSIPTNLSIGSFNLDILSIGINHQSNGQYEALSRSWNRLVGMAVLSNEKVAISLRPWYRFSEKRSSDDNPEITKYYGSFDLTVAYKFNDYMVSAMARNNLRGDDNKGYFEINFNFPSGMGMRGYFQYLTGYGETLIDYNRYVNRVGLGFVIVDWL